MSQSIDNHVENVDPVPTESQIIQIYYLSGPVVACVLVAQDSHFDLELLFTRFTRPGPHSIQRPISSYQCTKDDLWVFSLKYYYTDFDRPAYTGQQRSPLHKKHPGRYILRGSSVIALRFFDNSLGNGQNRATV